jgi:predicted DNA repair protein MutK
MIKKSILAVVAVFIAWSVMDILIHGVMLKNIYVATASMWRPEAEMKMGAMYLVGLVAAICFVGIYACVVNPKSMGAALRFAFLFGLGVGISMGFGTYCVMPIPLNLAIGWLLGTVAEALVGGLLVGLIVKSSPESRS